MPRFTLCIDLPISRSWFLSRSQPTSGVVVAGLLLLMSGCQSSGSLANLFPKTPKPTKSVQSLVGGQKNKAGLPPATKSKSDNAALAKSLDAAQSALSKYYQDNSHTSQQAHLAEADRNYRESLQIDARNPEANHGLAIIHDLRNDYTTAELFYRSALEQDPENSAILGDLGYSCLLQGKLGEAEQYLRQATQRDPGNTQAVKNLACVYGKQGQYNLAESTFRRVLDDGEVLQEMTRLFPNGRPDVAENERKFPWPGENQSTLPTTDALKTRLEEARQKDLASMQGKRALIDQYTAPQPTIEELKATIAQLEAERDAAHRPLEPQTAANTPLVIGDNPASGSEMQIQPRPQFGELAGPRKATNSMFPQGVPNSNPQHIQQAGNQVAPGAIGKTDVRQAVHQTSNQIDPHTGLPRRDPILPVQGQSEGLMVPNTFEPGQGNSPVDRYSPTPKSSPAVDQYEAAKRRAAMLGMGGPEMMFPVVEGTQRIAPGTGSTYNGGQYPAPPRYLPTEAAPHDLNRLLNAPSGQYTVQPNDKGQLNAPTGPSFQNPNFETRLQPEIPVHSPLGPPNLYQDQATSAQSDYAAQTQPPAYDPRGQVNTDLYQYGTSHQYNPSQFNPSVTSQIGSPSMGVPGQIQPPRGADLMNRGDWSQQEMTPGIMPPPYAGRPAENTPASYESVDRTAPESFPSVQSGTPVDHSNPPAIYSPGVQAPPDYRSRNTQRSSSGPPAYYSNGGGPRITPSR